MVKNKKEYGKQEQPVIIVWCGNDPLTVGETILKDELINLYGYRNVHQFTNCASVDEFLQRHKNLRHLKPAIMCVYSPEIEAEIADLFQGKHDNFLSKKLLVLACMACKLPEVDMSTDDTIILTNFIQEEIRQYLIKTIGDPVEDSKDPAELIKEHAATA